MLLETPPLPSQTTDTPGRQMAKHAQIKCFDRTIPVWLSHLLFVIFSPVLTDSILMPSVPKLRK